MSDEKIRILLADDHALVREGIRRVLEEDPDFEVVAEAADGEEAVALAREHRPDVAVVDISMPNASGFEVTARLQAEVTSTRVLILSMHDDVEYVMRAVRAGARGYLLKDEAGPSQLREAVRAVHSGSSFFTSEVAARLAAGLRGDDEQQGDDENGDVLERSIHPAIISVSAASPRPVSTWRQRKTRRRWSCPS